MGPLRTATARPPSPQTSARPRRPLERGTSPVGGWPWAFAHTTGEVTGRGFRTVPGWDTPCAGKQQMCRVPAPANRARHRSVSTLGAFRADPVSGRDNVRAQQRSWPGDISGARSRPRVSSGTAGTAPAQGAKGHGDHHTGDRAFPEVRRVTGMERGGLSGALSPRLPVQEGAWLRRQATLAARPSKRSARRGCRPGR